MERGFVANYVPVLMTIQHRGHRPSYYFAVFAKMADGSFFFLFSFEKFINTHTPLWFLLDRLYTRDPALVSDDDCYRYTRDCLNEISSEANEI
jgi:hypothetical protein